MPDTRIPRVLVLGATGRVGTAVVRELEATRGVVTPVRASRSAATVQRWIDEGMDAAYAAGTLIWGAPDLSGPLRLRSGHHQHGRGSAGPRPGPPGRLGRRTPPGTARPALLTVTAPVPLGDHVIEAAAACFRRALSRCTSGLRAVPVRTTVNTVRVTGVRSGCTLISGCSPMASRGASATPAPTARRCPPVRASAGRGGDGSPHQRVAVHGKEPFSVLFGIPYFSLRVALWCGAIRARPVTPGRVGLRPGLSASSPPRSRPRAPRPG